MISIAMSALGSLIGFALDPVFSWIFSIVKNRKKLTNNHLPSTLDNYYELYLAEPDTKRVEVSSEKNLPYEVYYHLYLDPNHETDRWHDPQPASKRFANILKRQEEGIHVILGEPGGGKTTLLNHWANYSYENYDKVKNQPAPIYIRLREIDDKENTRSAIINYLQKNTAQEMDLERFFNKKAKAIWFFDGFDEIKEETRKSWVSYIRSLGGQKIVSCRVLRYQDDFGKDASKYLIYGLNDEQKKEYLQKILPELQKSDNHKNADARWLDEFSRKLYTRKHSRLYKLAINPLLLRLLAETDLRDELEQSKTRMQLFNNIMERRLGKGNISSIQKHNYKKMLAQIAYHVGLQFSFSEEALENAFVQVNSDDNKLNLKNIEKDFLECDVLRKVGNSYEFLHATFHEWALAHYLSFQDDPLISAVKQYWYDPKYDEVISLLWSHNTVDDEQRAKATNFLMNAGCQEYEIKDKKRWRSGLKQSILFWDMTGIQIPDAIAEKIWQEMGNSLGLQIALASMQLNQGFLLNKLTTVENIEVLRELAWNENITQEMIQKLFNTQDIEILDGLTRNGSITQEMMQELFNTNDTDILIGLAWNGSITQEMMQELFNTQDTEVLERLARNGNITQEMMQKLFNIQNTEIRRGLAGNGNITQEIMQKLFNTQDTIVRRGLAWNRNITQEIMQKLSNTQDIEILRELAGNTNITQEIMQKLFNTQDIEILRKLAGNTNITQEIMQKLSNTQDTEILRGFVWNPNITQEIMQKLSNTQDTIILRILASNENFCWEIFLEE